MSAPRVPVSLLFTVALSAPAAGQGLITDTLLKDLNPTGSGFFSTTDFFVRVGHRVFFVGYTAELGSELWVTDGTEEGTELVLDIRPGAAGSLPDSPVVLGDQLLFHANDGVHGDELWTSDGTPGGTSLVADVNPGTGSVGPIDQVLFEGQSIFRRDDGTHGHEPWRSDGTAAGTTLLADAWPGGAGSFPSCFRVVGDRVVFSASSAEDGREPWMTDGTPAGTSLLVDIHAGPDSSLYSIDLCEALEVDGVLYFVAATAATGRELWCTDGTAAGTALVADVLPGPEGSEPRALTALPGGFLFSARTPGEGRELWKSDGTAAGTSLVHEFRPGPGDGFHPAHEEARREWRSFDGRVLVTEAWSSPVPGTPDLDVGLWISDGTAAGTERLASDFLPPHLEGYVGSEYRGSVYALTPGPDQAFFFGARDVVGPGLHYEWVLWATDGTPAGTSSLGYTFNAPELLSFAGLPLGFTVATTHDEGVEPYPERMFTLAGGRSLLFVPLSALPGAPSFPPIGRELWVGDGTLAGSKPLTDTAAGTGSFLPNPWHELHGISLGGTLLFTADDGVVGKELHAISIASTGEWHVDSFGEGCSDLELDLAGSLALGASFTLELEGAGAGAPTLLFAGDVPAGLPLGKTCVAWMANPQVVGAGAADAGGAIQWGYAVPATPALVGAPVVVQAFAASLGGPVLGVGELSNALELIPGP